MAANPADLGRRSAEKSSFSVTCGLLSRYLKEKGSFGDLSLEMTRTAHDGKGKSETLRTMNLLPSMKAAAADESAKKEAVSDRNATESMYLFPQHADLGPSSAPALDDARKNNTADVRELERAPQMTIFYGGKVAVFNNFPTEKARELMAVAGRGSPSPASHNSGVEHQQQHNSGTFTSIADAKPATVARDRPQRPPMVADLPIARKVSLHRFLEKRKERISSRAPYQVNGSSSGEAAAATSASGPAPVKPVERKTWLGIAPQVPDQEALPR